MPEHPDEFEVALRTWSAQEEIIGEAYAISPRSRISTPPLLRRSPPLAGVVMQIKAAKLKYDHAGELPRVGDVTEEYLKPVHDREISRLVREGRDTMRTVRKQVDVRDRLFERYDARLAGLLFGTWLQLSALGEKATRENMSRRTFYRHCKQLQDAGVSWRGSDVLHVPGVSVFPQDFQPLRSDPRRIAGEHPTVSEKQAAGRVA